MPEEADGIDIKTDDEASVCDFCVEFVNDWGHYLADVASNNRLEREFLITQEEAEKILDGNEWNCRRRAHPAEKYCLFHQRSDYRRERWGVTDQELSYIFAEAINGTLETSNGENEEWTSPFVEPREDDTPDIISRREKQFIGANLGSLDLTYEGLDAEDQYPIDLRGASVDRLNWEKAFIGHDIIAKGLSFREINLDGVVLTGSVHLSKIYQKDVPNSDKDTEKGSLGDAEIGGGVSLDHAEIGDSVSLKSAEIGDSVSLNSAEIGDLVSLKHAEIGDSVSISFAEIGDFVSLKHAEIGGLVGLSDAEIGAEVSLDHAEIGDWVTLKSAEIGDGVSLDHAEIGDWVFLKSAEIGAEVSLQDVEIGGKMTLEEAEVIDVVSIKETTIGGRLRFDGLTTSSHFNICDTVVSGSVIGWKATIGGDCKFEPINGKSDDMQISIYGIIDLSRATIEGSLYIEADCVKSPHNYYDTQNGTEFNAILLRGTTIFSGELTEKRQHPTERPVVYDLRQASIGKVDIQEIPADDFVAFNCVRFLDTEFNGFEFGKNRQEFHDTGWALDEVREEGRRDIARAAALVDQPLLSGVSDPTPTESVVEDARTVLRGVLDEVTQTTNNHAESGMDTNTGDVEAIVHSEIRSVLDYQDIIPESDKNRWEYDIISQGKIRVSDFTNAILPGEDLKRGTKQDNNHSPLKKSEIIDRQEELQQWAELGSSALDARSKYQTHPDPNARAERHFRWLQRGLTKNKSDHNITFDAEELASIIVDKLCNGESVTPTNEVVDELLETVSGHQNSDSPTYEDIETAVSRAWVAIKRIEDELEAAEDEVLKHALQYQKEGKQYPSHEAEAFFRWLIIKVADWKIDQSGVLERDPELNILESTYSKAKRAATEDGENTAAASFFIRELKYARLNHWNRSLDAARKARSVNQTGNSEPGTSTYQPDAEEDNDEEEETIDAQVEAHSNGGVTQTESDEEARVETDVQDIDSEKESVDAAPSTLSNSGSGDPEDVVEVASSKHPHTGNSVQNGFQYRWQQCKHLYNWATNVFLWLLTGYGEKPQRVIAWSAIVVVVFSGLFLATNAAQGFEAFGENTHPSNSYLGYFMISLGSFTTIIFGTPEAESAWIQLLAQIEGFLGMFLVGVFVFTLTRSIQR